MIPMEQMREEELDQEAWDLTRQLVMIDSSDPGAYEKNIGEFICQWFAARGIETRKEEVLPNRFNVMAECGASQGRALVFICHMDTVILGEGWSKERGPLDGKTEQIWKDAKICGSKDSGKNRFSERLYGRGACDMKSGLACAMVAFAYAAGRMNRARREAEPRGAGTGSADRPISCSNISRLVFIGTVDEEDFMRGAEAAVRSGWVKAEDWIVDMEPTDGQIQAAHKGRLWCEMTVKGAAAHASMPWKGADAIAAMAEMISHIRKAFGGLPVHPELGISTVTFGQIQGGVRPYVVPESCQVWIDMRLTPPTNRAAAEKILQAGIAAAKEAVPGIEGNYRITGDRPFIERNPESGLYRALQQSCFRVTGQEAKTGPFPGYTDTAVIAGLLHGRDCMSYGPGSLSMAHKPNEYVDRDDVIRCRRVFCDLAVRVLHGS